MPKAITLSAGALALVKLHRELKGHIPVDDTTRELYRELAGRADDRLAHFHRRARGPVSVHGCGLGFCRLFEECVIASG